MMSKRAALFLGAMVVLFFIMSPAGSQEGAKVAKAKAKAPVVAADASSTTAAVNAATAADTAADPEHAGAAAAAGKTEEATAHPPPVAPASAADDDIGPWLQQMNDDVFNAYPHMMYPEAVETASDKMNDEYYWPQYHRVYGARNGTEIGGVEGLHMFYTTDCTQHSLWQSLALENTWAKVRQPGAITRVVSGCHTGLDGAPSPNAHMLARRVVDHDRVFVYYAPKSGGGMARRAAAACTEEAGKDTAGVDPVHARDGITGGWSQCRADCAVHSTCRRWNYRASTATCLFFVDVDGGAVDPDPDYKRGICREKFAKRLKPDKRTMQSYAPLNRPFTSMLWLHRAKVLERVLCLLDPDFVFTRAMTFHVSPKPMQEGQSRANFYVYMNQRTWVGYYEQMCEKDEARGAVCAAVDNPVDYSIGPPHMMLRRDWKRVAPWWTRYTLEHMVLWGDWISEMGGMSSALARYNLRSRLAHNAQWDGYIRGTSELIQRSLTPAALDGGWLLCASHGEPCELPGYADQFVVRYGKSHDAATEKTVSRADGPFICSDGTEGLFGGARVAPTGMSFAVHNHERVNHVDGCFVKPVGGELPPMRERMGWIYCANAGEACHLPTHEGATQYTVRYGAAPLWGYTEVTKTAGASFQCGEGAAPAEPGAPNPQCYYKGIDAKLAAPPVLDDYVLGSGLPGVFHYCATFETSREGLDKQFWNGNGREQRAWEEEHGEPLMKYFHYSKYRLFTDWGGPPKRTMLACDHPMLYDPPPLPVVMDPKWAPDFKHRESMIFYNVIATAVNDALVKYKLKYCEKGAVMNFARIGRTAHNGNWLSLFRTVGVPEAPYYRHERV